MGFCGFPRPFPLFMNESGNRSRDAVPIVGMRSPNIRNRAAGTRGVAEGDALPSSGLSREQRRGQAVGGGRRIRVHRTEGYVEVLERPFQSM